MKKTSVLIVMTFITLFSFCQNEEVNLKKTQIDIYYFHRTERCNTCLSIEENTKKVLEQFFPEEYKDGSITFISINFESDDHKKIVEKYKADGPTLYLAKTKKGKEKSKNLTDFALENSLYNAEKFKNGLRDKINELMR